MADEPNTDHCRAIAPDCPLELTIYGYWVSKSASLFGAIIFSVCCIVNIYFGVRYKTWTYMIAMVLGTGTSAAGYVGRVMMSSNPWSEIGFMLQIICLTFSPAFNSAAIYLILKHVALRFGAAWSRIPPRFYPWGFISADIIALIMQSAGGAIAAVSDSEDMMKYADGLMIGGVTFQVVTLVVFGVMITDYSIRRWQSPTPLSAKAAETWTDLKFRIFGVALVVLYCAILIRCIYRIAELAGGWQSSIMQNQGLFIALDTIMMAICTSLQSFIHPGVFFPAMAEPQAEGSEKLSDRPKSGSEHSLTPMNEHPQDQERYGHQHGWREQEARTRWQQAV